MMLVSATTAASRTVLHDISFTASPGTVTALVGLSGSGKSTTLSDLCLHSTSPKGVVAWTASNSHTVA